jgi:hypothetical protein
VDKKNVNLNVQFYLLIYLISYPIILLIHQLLYSRSVPYYLFLLPFIYLIMLFSCLYLLVLSHFKFNV